MRVPRGAGGSEAPSWAAPRTAPGPGLSCALTPSHSHRHSRSAARWPSPTCSHPSSLPHSFSRSGCTSMLTVTIFSRICLKSLVRVLPSPSLRSLPPLDPFFFFSASPPALGLTFRLATETSTRKFIFCFDVNPQTLNFFISKTGRSRKRGESRDWGHRSSKCLWPPRSASLSPRPSEGSVALSSAG